MCKEHYLVVMKLTEPHIGHAPFLSAMCFKVSIWRESDSAEDTIVRDTKLDMCKEHYLVVMKLTEPHIGHAPFLSAMCLKVPIWRERVVYAYTTKLYV